MESRMGGQQKQRPRDGFMKSELGGSFQECAWAVRQSPDRIP